MKTIKTIYTAILFLMMIGMVYGQPYEVKQSYSISSIRYIASGYTLNNITDQLVYYRETDKLEIEGDTGCLIRMLLEQLLKQDSFNSTLIERIYKPIWIGADTTVFVRTRTDNHYLGQKQLSKLDVDYRKSVERCSMQIVENHESADGHKYVRVFNGGKVAILKDDSILFVMDSLAAIKAMFHSYEKNSKRVWSKYAESNRDYWNLRSEYVQLEAKYNDLLKKSVDFYNCSEVFIKKGKNDCAWDDYNRILTENGFEDSKDSTETFSCCPTPKKHYFAGRGSR